MDQASADKPRIEKGKSMRIVGLKRHYTADTMNQIPAQWASFTPTIEKIPGLKGRERVAYGACFLGSEGIEYLTGVEVSDGSEVPSGMSAVKVPARTYAVFAHPGHVSTLRDTLEAIQTKFLPASGFQPPAKAEGVPDFHERYGGGFDPQTGLGDIEVWVPIKD